MADARRVVELVFQGVDETGAATQAALRNAKELTGNVQSVTAPIANATQSLLKYEAAMLATGAAITALSVKVAGDFDTAFREISTLVDVPTEELNQFRSDILAFAQISTQPITEITAAVYSAISAGVSDLDEALRAVEQAERLAIAGNADLNASLVVLVSSLNAYNLTMDDAQRFSDALFATVKGGQTTLPELSASLANVTGTAATLEVPFETITAAIATLTAQGTPTNRAITQINAALNSLLNPSQQARNLAAELGIEFGATAVKANGFENVLLDVARATAGSEEQIAQLFGSSQALQAVLPLMGAAADSFAANLENMQNKAGLVDEAFDRMAGSVRLSNQRVVNALQGTLIQIGDPLLEQYGGIADAIAGIFQALGTAISQGELEAITGALQALAVDIERTLRRIAENLPAALAQADFGAFAQGLQVVVDAVRGLFVGADLTSVDGLTRAIEGVGKAFLALSEFSAGAIESFGLAVDLLFRLAGTVADTDSELFRFAGNVGGVVTQLNAMLPLVEILIGLMIAKQGVGLIGHLATAAKNVGLLTAAKGGLVIAAGASTVKIGELVGILIDWGLAARDARLNQIELTSSNEDISRQLAALSADLGISITSLEEFRNLVSAGTIVADEFGDGWRLAGDTVVDSTNKLKSGIRAAGDEALLIVDSIDEMNQLVASGVIAVEDFGRTWDFSGAAALAATEGAADAMREVADESDRAGAALDRFGMPIRGVQETLEGGVRTFQDFGSAGRRAFDDAKEGAEAATRASAEFLLGLEKIQSEERLRLIEIKADLDIASIEAETERITAAFSSIDNTISSTGDTLVGLFGALSDLSGFEALDARAEIRRESERRDEALRLQSDLIRTQIENLRAQSERLLRGDPVIQVDGAGLQPHLEAFMFEILRTVQVRVNADGLDFLLGV